MKSDLFWLKRLKEKFQLKKDKKRSSICTQRLTNHSLQFSHFKFYSFFFTSEIINRQSSVISLTSMWTFWHSFQSLRSRIRSTSHATWFSLRFFTSWNSVWVILSHNLVFRHSIIFCLFFDLVSLSSLITTASWIVLTFRLAERLVIDDAWLSLDTAEIIIVASSKSDTVTDASEESSIEKYMKTSHLQKSDRRFRHHRAVNMHVFVIESLSRQHQQMLETSAELISTWLFN